jgi:hypothetical protein
VTVPGLPPRAVGLLSPALLGLLAAGELIVLVRFSPPLGVGLLATTVALWALVKRSRAIETARREREVEATAQGHSSFFRIRPGCRTASTSSISSRATSPATRYSL